eukprot:SM000034S12743  [mRNA]  locus=s34:526534:530185:+ [translate_table: standard]
MQREERPKALAKRAMALLLEPLAAVKAADKRTGFSQGALDELMGEELSVLPGMDSLLAVATLERLARPTGGLLSPGDGSGEEAFDVVVFDGPSSSEVLRIFGAPERTRWYLRRAKSAAEKTDAGRVALPSIARLAESAVKRSGSSDRPERTTAEIWEGVDQLFAKAANSFSSSKSFAGLLVTTAEAASMKTALRLWGSALHAGMFVAGALLTPSHQAASPDPAIQSTFMPLQLFPLPELVAHGGQVDWAVAVRHLAPAANMLAGSGLDAIPPATAIDSATGTVVLFLPGFDKSEVKLSQWRGGSELLVEVGDQRRSIAIPAGMRGKVVGARFQGPSLTITLAKK